MSQLNKWIENLFAACLEPETNYKEAYIKYALAQINKHIKEQNNGN